MDPDNASLDNVAASLINRPVGMFQKRNCKAGWSETKMTPTEFPGARQAALAIAMDHQPRAERRAA